jgi:hypothetical protein
VLFTATWTVAGLTEPNFSFVHNDTSDLGALTARHALPYNIALSASGLLTIGLAAALLLFLPRRRAGVVGAALVAIFGIGQFIDGLAREDCAVSVNAVCRAAEKAGRVSTHHKVHNAESLVTFSALILAPFVVGLVFRSMPAWRRLGLWSLGAAAVELACLPFFLALYDAGANGQGAVEIVLLTAGVGWIALVGLAILRSPPLGRVGRHERNTCAAS